MGGLRAFSDDDFKLQASDVSMRMVDGVPSINFSEHVHDLIEKSMARTIIIKLLGIRKADLAIWGMNDEQIRDSPKLHLLLVVMKGLDWNLEYGFGDDHGLGCDINLVDISEGESFQELLMA
ncbi:hypothetical protein Goklo_006769 [Gossypium klotzschianum]|uniref:Uncharacterized protein n=1 Tax=Gossypium klotzschianum TaxID=34286 RepID=A0A7J8VIV0_9ROSI|nr:hypothetical protein [Gossypium klotzschianum]